MSAGCGLFLLFCVAMILTIIFLGLTHDRSEDVLCSLFKLPSGIIDGVNDSYAKYIGIAGLKFAYGNFTTE